MAAAPDARMAAVAPSFRPDALPAVMRPCGRNGVFSVGEALERGLGTHHLVAGGESPALLGADGDGHQVLLDLPGLVRRGGLLLAGEREAVAALLGQLREAVVDALGGRAHDEGVLADEALAEEAGVRVDAGAHRVVAHVLDAAGDGDVVHAEADRARHHGGGGHGAGAHAVDREARHGLRESGEDRGRAPEREALVAGLGGGRDRDVVDAVLRHVRIAFEECDDRLDDEVVGSRVPVHALFTGSAERGSDPVDEHDFSSFSHAAAPFRSGCLRSYERDPRALNRLTEPTNRPSRHPERIVPPRQRHPRLSVRLPQPATGALRAPPARIRRPPRWARPADSTRPDAGGRA